MALKFYRLYKIDRDNDTAVEENFENLANIENYVEQVIESIEVNMSESFGL